MERIISAVIVFLGMGVALWGLSRGNRRVGGCGCGCACSQKCEPEECGEDEQA